MAPKLPNAVHLPSGRVVRLSDGAAARARAALAPDGKEPFSQAIALLSAEGVLASDKGEPLDVLSLAVRDIHVLRALVALSGHVPEERVEFTCENCSAPFEVAPSALLEAAPFADGELSDPELDAPFPFGEALLIPRISLPAARVRTRRDARVADTVTFAERTGEEALSLFRLADALIAGRARALRITPSVVLAMGVVALGTERRTPVIADALASASNAAWAKVVEHWHEAAYSRRLFGLHRCEGCGARNDLDVPLARELDREHHPTPRARGRSKGAAFPDLDAFQALVEAHAERIYAERGVRNIDLFVDAAVPHVDDGGEPLLGSYLPGGVDETTGVPRPPEVRIYYRTFESEFRADPGFDVEGEIHETIDHEIEHHLNHLAGTDPLDEEEHAEIEREEMRRVGARETARRGKQAAFESATGFVRATWPLWVAVLIASLILWSSR